MPPPKGKAGSGEDDEDGEPTVGGGERKKSSTRKYSCPKCGNSVRATKDLALICGDCYNNDSSITFMTKA